MESKPFSWVPVALDGRGHMAPYSEPEHLLESYIANSKLVEQSLKTAASSDTADTDRDQVAGSAASSSRKTLPNKVRSLVDSFSPSSSNVAGAAPPKETPTATCVEYDVKTVKKYEEDLKANVTGGKSPVVVSFLDLGGQEVFYALHPYFITSAGLFLIVFNMEHLLPTAPAEERAEALAYIKRWINATIVSAAVIALNVALYHIVQFEHR